MFFSFLTFFLFSFVLMLYLLLLLFFVFVFLLLFFWGVTLLKCMNIVKSSLVLEYMTQLYLTGII